MAAARRQRSNTDNTEFLINSFDTPFAGLNFGGVKNVSFQELQIFLSVQPLDQTSEASTFVAVI